MNPGDVSRPASESGEIARVGWQAGEIEIFRDLPSHLAFHDPVVEKMTHLLLARFTQRCILAPVR